MKKTYLTLFSVLALAGTAACQSAATENEPSWTEVKSDKNVTISMAKTKCGDENVLLLRLINKSFEKHIVNISVPAEVTNLSVSNIQLSIDLNQVLEGVCSTTKTMELAWFFEGSIPQNLNLVSTVN